MVLDGMLLVESPSGSRGLGGSGGSGGGGAGNNN